MKFITIEDPPYEIKGKGTPANGVIITCEERFNKVCTPIKIMIPAANSLPNILEVFKVIKKPKKRWKTNKEIRRTEPINPVSSA